MLRRLLVTAAHAIGERLLERCDASSRPLCFWTCRSSACDWPQPALLHALRRRRSSSCAAAAASRLSRFASCVMSHCINAGAASVVQQHSFLSEWRSGSGSGAPDHRVGSRCPWRRCSRCVCVCVCWWAVAISPNTAALPLVYFIADKLPSFELRFQKAVNECGVKVLWYVLQSLGYHTCALLNLSFCTAYLRIPHPLIWVSQKFWLLWPSLLRTSPR